MSLHSWNSLALLRAKHFQRQFLPLCFAKKDSGAEIWEGWVLWDFEFLRVLCFPCREWQELAFLALLARRGRKESRWVGNLTVRFALKSPQCLQSLLQYLGFPWDPVVPRGKGERRDSGFKI